MLFINYTGSGTPNLLELQNGGADTFVVDNSGNIAVNGGSITTTQSTANIFNTGVSTLNIGGVATAINLGASTGTTTVNNNLAVTGTGTFTNTLTANGTLAANGIADIGNGGSTIALNGTAITVTANGVIWNNNN